MTPHQQITHLDGSVSVRIYQGGWWTVRKGIGTCDASKFCADQNKWIERWHQSSVRDYVGMGEAA